MTVPVERTNAVNFTRSFLYDLIDPQKTPRVPKAVRQRALSLLRHYPTDFDMQTIADREDGIGNRMCVHKVFGNDYK